MPSRWEVMLAGSQGAAIPLAAPQAVVSGWLDDPPGQGSESVSRVGGRSAHAGPKRAWACGPFGTFTPGGAGLADGVTVMQVRLLDDSLADRLREAVQPGRSVRLGAHRYQVAGPAAGSARSPGQGCGTGRENVPGRSVSSRRCACAGGTGPRRGRRRSRWRGAWPSDGTGCTRRPRRPCRGPGRARCG